MCDKLIKTNHVRLGQDDLAKRSRSQQAVRDDGGGLLFYARQESADAMPRLPANVAG